ncbi:Imm1 family immunity protein [Streptomyces sp. NBC_00102]|nr:Imm1 family immunity protein [Streptomyces sp. NBC_00102]
MEGGVNVRARAEARYRVESGDKPEILYAPEDIDPVIDKLLVDQSGPIRETLAQIHSLEREVLPSGYPDHELMVGVDRDLQVGVLSFMDGSGNSVTLGAPEGRNDPAYYIQGHMTEFPACSEIPISLVRQAAREFISSGGQRPACVNWQPLTSW